MVARSPSRAHALPLLALLLLALSDAPAAAETSVGVKLRLLETLLRVSEGDWAMLTLGTARVSLSATSESVKAELAVDGLLGESAVASLARASVAARFPWFRLTMGKARLAWGEGVVFNAADLLYGSSSAAGLDLTAETLRDDAAWMAAVYVPLGRFSFAEAVVLPPPLDVAAFIQDPAAPLPDPADAAIGGRIVGKLAGVKTEAAYLYRGETGSHSVAASLQGNLFVDWHLSASASLPAISPALKDLADSLLLSAGLFHLQRLGPRASLSLRLEALAAPAGAWQEVDPAPPPAPATVYGLLLYPEISLAFDNAISLAARALVSPVDGSALIVPGVSVSVHKGLSFLGMASVSIGDETDNWSWSRQAGLSFVLGCAYSY